MSVTCKYCGKVYSYKKALLNHRVWDCRMQQRNITLQCRICKKVFTRPATLLRHHKKKKRCKGPTKDALNSHATCEDGKVLFNGLRFCVQLESDQDKERVISIIRSYSGEIIDCKDAKQSDIDIMITTPVYDARGTNPLKVFTKFWLSDVVDRNSLEIPEEHYHTPYPSEEGMRNLFQDVVIAVSAYPVKTKEYIRQMSIALGATVQEVFSRKLTNDTLRTTHLICGVADNKKHKASKRWGIPAVTLGWIVESCKYGQKLDLDDFLLDNQDRVLKEQMKRECATPPANLPRTSRRPSTPIEEVVRSCQEKCDKAIAALVAMQKAQRALEPPPDPKHEERVTPTQTPERVPNATNDASKEPERSGGSRKRGQDSSTDDEELVILKKRQKNHSDSSPNGRAENDNNSPLVTPQTAAIDNKVTASETIRGAIGRFYNSFCQRFRGTRDSSQSR